MWTEPAVLTRCGRGDPIHDELRRIISVPTKRHLWVPEDAITFIPALCDTIFGDGRALYHLATCNSRPAYYVIRAHSEWEESNFYCGHRNTFGEFTDAIYQSLEDQFGSARLDSEEDDPELLADGFYPWPALDDENGCGWAIQRWPKEFDGRVEVIRNEFGWTRHTLLKREYAFEDQHAQWADDGGPVLERRFY